MTIVPARLLSCWFARQLFFDGRSDPPRNGRIGAFACRLDGLVLLGGQTELERSVVLHAATVHVHTAIDNHLATGYGWWAMAKAEAVGYRAMLRHKWELRQLLRIHDGKCSACGCAVSLKDEHSPRYATIDHTLPLSKGGSDLMTNKTLMCLECNGKKGAS